MRKTMIGLSAAIISTFFLLLVLLLMGGGGTVDPVGPLATDDVTIAYAKTCSKLHTPWEVVMLTDAIYAQREGADGIENVNPLLTALQFSRMTVSMNELEISVDEETGEEIQSWRVAKTATYTGRDEILAALSLADEDLDGLDADTFLAKMERILSDRSTEDRRYTGDILGNYDLSSVLEQYTNLTDEERPAVLDLYGSGYLLDRLDDGTREQVHQIMAKNGMYQHITIDGDYESLDGVLFTGGATDVVYYCQLDPKWAHQPYGTDEIGSHGCGPTAMSIVVSSLCSGAYDPIYMANWAYQNGYWAKGAGSYHTLICGAAKAFGLIGEGCPYTDPQRIVDTLENGGLVVALMGPGHFTRSGHFIVLRGVTEAGGILVADPASYTKSEQVWPLETIIAESIKHAADGGPFWAITKGDGDGT